MFSCYVSSLCFVQVDGRTVEPFVLLSAACALGEFYELDEGPFLRIQNSSRNSYILYTAGPGTTYEQYMTY
jgi:hypothetical protein